MTNVSKEQNDGSDLTTHCIECAEKILPKAKKCKVCGSYQDFRRFLNFGHSGLALLLAGIALLGHFAGISDRLTYSARDFLTGTNFSLNVALISIDKDEVSFLVSSRRPALIAIDNISCTLQLVVDPADYSHKKFVRFEYDFPPPEDMNIELSKTIGGFLVVFELDPIQTLEPLERMIVSGTRLFVSPPLSSKAVDDPSNTSSFCFVGSVDEDGEKSAGTLVLELDDVSRIDVIEILRLSDYKDPNSPAREMLIETVKQTRAANEEARQAEASSIDGVPEN